MIKIKCANYTIIELHDLVYINHSFHNGFFHRVFDGSTTPRMRAQYSHLPHEYDHGIPRELPGDTTLFSAVHPPPGHPGKPTKAPQTLWSIEQAAFVTGAITIKAFIEKNAITIEKKKKNVYYGK